MLRADYRPRETYVAFCALARNFSGRTFKKTHFNAAGRYFLEFDDCGRGVLFAAWNGSGTNLTAVSVATDAKRVERIDMFGNRRVIPVRAGMVTFEFGIDPAALVLHGATRAVPSYADLSNIPPPDGKGVRIPSDAPGRAPDFVLDSHDQVTDFFAANPAEVRRLWTGPEDLSAEIWLSHDVAGIRLKARVRDDRHVQAESGGMQYTGDDIQVAFGSHLQRGGWEFGLAQGRDGKPAVHCWIAPGGCDAAKAASGVRLRFQREADVSCYDAYFPFEILSFHSGIVNDGFRFNVLVNDNDGDGRDGAIEITKDNFNTKDVGTYPLVRFDSGSKKKKSKVEQKGR